MSLDKNLFTLLFTPLDNNPNVVDLTDPTGKVHYRKQRTPGDGAGNDYRIEVYDYDSQSLLATVSAPNASSKAKTIELHNPTSVVEIKYTGTFSFRWSFTYEENEFEWKREECFIIRRPDPPVNVAVTREPNSKQRLQSVQMLDYNLNRFEIQDRKGLEIVILTALMTFVDAAREGAAGAAAPATPIGSSSSQAAAIVGVPPNIAAMQNARRGRQGSGSSSVQPPALPSKPAPKTGVDRIAEIQTGKGEYNEIIVEEEGSVEDYGEFCNRLLQDDAMLFITVMSSDALFVPKVLQVVEETKRIRYKRGLSDEEELHQYVLYDTLEQRKGPRRINLDADPKNKYEPPKSLVVHLSKITMPDLQPKASQRKDDKKPLKVSTSQPRPAPPPPSSSTYTGGSGGRPPSTPISGSGKPHSQSYRPPPPPQPQSMLNGKPGPHKLHKPTSAGGPGRVSPAPGRPTPSQLNNPGIYNPPPPPPGMSGRPPMSGMQRPSQSYYPGGFAPPGPPPAATFPQGNAPSYQWTGPAPPPPPPPSQGMPGGMPPTPQPGPGSGATSPGGAKPLSTSQIVHGIFDLLSQGRK